jgi:chromosome segregation ATPase
MHGDEPCYDCITKDIKDINGELHNIASRVNRLEMGQDTLSQSVSMHGERVLLHEASMEAKIDAIHTRMDKQIVAFDKKIEALSSTLSSINVNIKLISEVVLSTKSTTDENTSFVHWAEFNLQRLLWISVGVATMVSGMWWLYDHGWISVQFGQEYPEGTPQSK